jgi:hypothetical protein
MVCAQLLDLGLHSLLGANRVNTRYFTNHVMFLARNYSYFTKNNYFISGLNLPIKRSVSFAEPKEKNKNKKFVKVNNKALHEYTNCPLSHVLVSLQWYDIFE